jgi:hypothetical protein
MRPTQLSALLKHFVQVRMTGTTYRDPVTLVGYRVQAP